MPPTAEAAPALVAATNAATATKSRRASTPRIDPHEVWPDTDSEASRVLTSMAHRKTADVSEALLVRHVLSITPTSDWPLRRGGMEAVLRRCKSSADEDLRGKSSGSRGALPQQFRVSRPEREARSYDVAVYSLDPLRASCNCQDYLRNSLGLCKHVIAVLPRVAARTPATARRNTTAADASSPIVRWDPVRPLLGPGDWLERISIAHLAPSKLESLFRGEVAADLVSHDGTSFVIARPALTDATRRHRVIQALIHATARGRGAAPPALAAEPAACALLAQESARLGVSATLTPEILKSATKALASLKRKLYPYQLAGLQTFLRTGRLLLADDMGLGKTAQAIAACHVMFHVGQVKHGIVIAPASLKSQWLREWQLFTDVPAVIVDGLAEDRARLWQSPPRGFLIANYEQVLRDLPLIQRLAPDMVVLDEAQRIKNWATKTAQCVKGLQPRFRLVLTGTPMENRLDELASVVEWVDDLALEPKWRLTPWHATAVDGKREVGGARHIDTLRLRLSTAMLRRVRDEVLDQLPARTDTAVPVELTAAQEAEHDALTPAIVRLLSIAKTRPLTPAQFLRLMQLFTTQRMIANGLALSEFTSRWPELRRVPHPTDEFVRTLSSPKLLELRELIRQLVGAQQRKVIVFSQWRRMLELAHWATRELVEAGGGRAVFFTGEESQRQRTANVVAFHDDPAVKVMFLTDAGGVGLNLQRAATCCINLEMPWNPAVLEQRIGRIHRLGQTRPIDVYNLVTESCIESRVASLVNDKAALFKGVFDGKSDEVRYERSGSFMVRIEKLVGDAALAAHSMKGTRRAPGDADDVDERDLDVVLPGVDGPAEKAEEITPPAAPAPSVAVAAERAPATAAVSPTPDPFARVRVTRRDDGSLTIDAPPEAAATLAGLLDGFARLLRDAGRQSP